MNTFQMVAVAVAGVAVVWDLATRRIPNVLTFGAALAAILVHGYVSGWSGAAMALAGWAAGAAFFFPFFALGGMGAGDVSCSRRSAPGWARVRGDVGRAVLGNGGRRARARRGDAVGLSLRRRSTICSPS